jgi:hypothetical protein
MRKITLICCVFVAATFLYSCEKDIAQEDKKVASLTEDQIDQNIKSLSEVVAYAVYNNNELVKEIEKEISYRFDYDNDALIKTFLGRKIAGEKFEDILSKSSNGKYSSKDIEKMILESGYLQFTFPQNYRDLNYESEPPLAVPVYSSINEEDTEFLESFDKDGNTVKLSAKEMPNVPVIIVGRSERVDEDGYMLVSERSVVLPKEMRTLHYTEAIKESRSNLKSAKLNQHIVTILSQEEFDKLPGEKEPKVTSDSRTTLKSANYSDLQLTVKTDNPKTNRLSWGSYSNGTYTSNRYKIMRDDMGNTPISTINDYTYYVDNVPYANVSYEYHIACYYNDIYLGRTNAYKLQSSHRRSGGQEYIDRLYASHEMVVSLEGWWVSELEIKWHILSGNYDGTSSEMYPGGNDYQCAKDSDRDFINPRHVFNNDDVNLFRWIKDDTYTSYTVYFRERDTGTNTEIWTTSVQIIGKVVSAVWADNKIVKDIAEGLVDPIIKFIEAYKYDDKIGETHVAWSTPNGDVQSVNENGFEVIINQKD